MIKLAQPWKEEGNKKKKEEEEELTSEEIERGCEFWRAEVGLKATEQVEASFLLTKHRLNKKVSLLGPK